MLSHLKMIITGQVLVTPHESSGRASDLDTWWRCRQAWWMSSNRYWHAKGWCYFSQTSLSYSSCKKSTNNQCQLSAAWPSLLESISCMKHSCSKCQSFSRKSLLNQMHELGHTAWLNWSQNEPFSSEASENTTNSEWCFSLSNQNYFKRIEQCNWQNGQGQLQNINKTSISKSRPN